MSEQKWDRESGIFAQLLEVEPRFSGQELVQWQHNKNESLTYLASTASATKSVLR